MKKMKRMMLVSSVAIILAACNSGVTGPAGQNNQPQKALASNQFAKYDQKQKQRLLANNPHMPVLELAVLGAGVFPGDSSIAPMQCLDIDPTKITLGAATSNIQLSSKSSLQDLEASLNINSSVTVGYGLFSGSAQANYLSSSADKSNSMHYLFLANYSRPVTVLSPKLNPNAEAYSKTPARFQQACGTSTIISQNLGMYFLSTLDISTGSSTEMKELKANLKLAYGSFVEATADIQTQSKKLGLNTSIQLSLHQVGGDPSKLADVLDKFGAKEGIINCSIDDIPKCNTVASAVIDYISDDSVGFQYQASQMAAAKDYTSLTNAGAANIGEPGEMSNGLIIANTGEPTSFSTVSQNLFDLYNTVSDVLTSLISIQSMTSPGSEQNQHLQDLINTSQRNQNIIKTKIDSCINGNGKCDDNMTLTYFTQNDIASLSNFKSVAFLKNNHTSVVDDGHTLPISSNDSYVLSVDNKKNLQISGHPGVNYVYGGINPQNQYVVSSAPIPVGYTATNSYVPAGHGDILMFNGTNMYLTLPSYTSCSVSSFLGSQCYLSASDIGYNGLPKTDQQMSMVSPYGYINYSYYYVESNPDYMKLTEFTK